MFSTLALFGVFLGRLPMYDTGETKVRARRVVVVGADDSGLAAIRELRRNGSRTVPIAFLGDGTFQPGPLDGQKYQ